MATALLPAAAKHALGINAFTCGDSPVWTKEAFKELVLQRCLEGGPTPMPPPPKLTLEALTESIAMMKVQLRTLFEGEAAGKLNQTLGRVHKAFEEAVEVARLFTQIKDHAGFFELLTTIVSRIKALTPGACMVLPGGFRGGLVIYVLLCEGFDEYTLAVCNSGEGLAFHPARLDPATGAAQFNTPLLFRRIPAMRVRDGALWFMLLRAACMGDAKQTASVLYTQVLPFLNSRPLLANVSQAEAQRYGLAADADPTPARRRRGQRPLSLVGSPGGSPGGGSLGRPLRI